MLSHRLQRSKVKVTRSTKLRSLRYETHHNLVDIVSWITMSQVIAQLQIEGQNHKVSISPSLCFNAFCCSPQSYNKICWQFKFGVRFHEIVKKVMVNRSQRMGASLTLQVAPLIVSANGTIILFISLFTVNWSSVQAYFSEMSLQCYVTRNEHKIPTSVIFWTQA